MKKLSFILMSIVALGFMTSCSSNDENASNSPVLKEGVTKTLTLNITGGQPGTGRSVGEIVAADEAKLNNLVVLVYDNNSSEQKFERVIKVENPSTTETLQFKTTKPSFFVLANVPMNAVDAAVGQGLAAFQALTASLNYTSINGAADGASQLSSALPMIGSTSSITEVDATNYTATVALHRMVSRVALTGFATNYANEDASFTVSDVFLVDVNSSSTFASADIASDVNASLSGEPIVSTPFDGMILPDGANNNTSSPNTPATYLNTPLTSVSSLSTAPVYFYVFPNKATVYANKTKLVIKGTYKASSVDPGSEKYYVCVVNAVPDGAKVQYSTTNSDSGTGFITANRTYSINVTATGEPLEDAEAGSSNDPEAVGANNVTMTISVTPWAANIVQNVTL